MITKATCPRCGRGALAHAGSLYDPIDGFLLTRTHGDEPQMRQAYLPHSCRDEDITDFQGKVSAVVQALEGHLANTALDVDSGDYEATRDHANKLSSEQIELIARHSLERPCSKCSAEVGHQCRNLTERKRGNDVPTASPHQERLPEVSRARIPEIEAVRSRLQSARDRVSQIYELLSTNEEIPQILADIRAGRY